MKQHTLFRHFILPALCLASMHAGATFFYFNSATVLTPVVSYGKINVLVTASLSDPCVTIDSTDMAFVNNRIMLVLHVSETTCLTGGACIAVITPYSNTFSLCPPAGLNGKYGFGLVINEYCPSVFPMTTDTIATTDSIQVHNYNTINQSGCDSVVYNGTVYHSSGNFVLPFSSAAGCDSSIHLQVSLNSPDTSVTQAGPLLTANATGAVYQWINCSGKVIIPGATAGSYTAVQNGSYAVVVTKNGCTDTSGCRTVSGLGLSNEAEATANSVYPNPVPHHQSFFVLNATGASNLELFDLSGRRLWQHAVPGPVPQSLPIPREPGCFLLRVTQADGGRAMIRILHN